MKKFGFYILCLISGVILSGTVRAETVDVIRRADSPVKIENNIIKSNSYSLASGAENEDVKAVNSGALEDVSQKAQNTTGRRAVKRDLKAPVIPYKSKEADDKKTENIMLKTSENTPNSIPVSSDKKIKVQTRGDKTEGDEKQNSINNDIKSDSYDDVEAVKTEKVTAKNNDLKEKNKNNKTSDISVDKEVYIIKYKEIPEEQFYKKGLSFYEEIAKFFIVPKILDKVYEGDEIKGDFSGMVRYIYPELKDDDVQRFTDYFRQMVLLTRKYRLMITTLQEMVKAEVLMPKDTPIVAKDGEFAPISMEGGKKSAPNKYQVSYKPYKYLEYDSGELGEPVRRRDKNYIEDYVPKNELMLALLRFDIKGLVKAWRKMPMFHDGSNEKLIKLPNGIYTRMLLKSAEPGEREDLQGVIEINLPDNMYLVGDYLNPETVPAFELEEGEKGAQNIKKLQFEMPLANGVQNNGKQYRVMVGTAYIPFTYARLNPKVKTVIKGHFSYVVCDKTHHCSRQRVAHEITVKPSENYSNSIYENIVNKVFSHLPMKRTEHAEVKSVVRTKDKLTVRFETTKTMSSAMVMAEDAIGTNYHTPRYEIGDDFVTASFEVNGTGDYQQEAVAISAIFDDNEELRTVVQPQNTAETYTEKTVTWKILLWCFLWGMMINFMPIAFYIFGQTTLLFKLYSKKTWLFYVLGVIGGLYIWYSFADYHHYTLYPVENLAVVVLSLTVFCSLTTEAAEYMDFERFRPWAKFLPRGMFYGGATVLAVAVLPVPYKDDILLLTDTVHKSAIKWIFLAITLGAVSLPIGLKYCKESIYLKEFWFMFKRFCLYYNGVALLWLGLAIMLVWGIWGLVWSLLIGALIWGLWYVYPLIWDKMLRPYRSPARKEKIFRQIEQHCSYALALLMIIEVVCLGLVERRTDVSDYQAGQLTQIIAENEKTLVVIEDVLALRTYINKAKLIELEKSGVRIVRLNRYDKNLKLWLQELPVLAQQDICKMYRMPVSVLFTERYRKGVVLPQNLNEVKFNQLMLGWYVEKLDLSKNHLSK